MSSPEQLLLLLADHIKLSLLERQRAQSLGLDSSDSQDGHLSRSLEQFRAGLESLQASGGQGNASAIPPNQSISSLRQQYDNLTAQFHGFATPSSSSITATTTTTTTTPANTPALLTNDFQHANTINTTTTTSSSSTPSPSAFRKSKSVRFSDTPSSPSPSQQLFGQYRDDPAAASDYRDHAHDLDNQQIHQYHSDIMEQQDQQLDRLGESISRQRELSMQIGDELDSHVAMLDHVDAAVDRHQSRLDRGQRILGKIARGAGENKQMTAIVALIIILVLLIAILK